MHALAPPRQGAPTQSDDGTTFRCSVLNPESGRQGARGRGMTLLPGNHCSRVGGQLGRLVGAHAAPAGRQTIHVVPTPTHHTPHRTRHATIATTPHANTNATRAHSATGRGGRYAAGKPHAPAATGRAGLPGGTYRAPRRLSRPSHQNGWPLQARACRLSDRRKMKRRIPVCKYGNRGSE